MQGNRIGIACRERFLTYKFVISGRGQAPGFKFLLVLKLKRVYDFQSF